MTRVPASTVTDDDHLTVPSSMVLVARLGGTAALLAAAAISAIRTPRLTRADEVLGKDNHEQSRASANSSVRADQQRRTLPASLVQHVASLADPRGQA